jgi:predicted nucleotidyltransferase
MVKKDFNKLTKITKELLQQRQIAINKIVVFGSYARNQAKKESDIDIIIVSKTFRNKDLFQRVALTSGLHRILVNKINKPFDIMFYSDSEWNKGDSLVVNAAKAEGKIIYST